MIKGKICPVSSYMSDNTPVDGARREEEFGPDNHLPESRLPPKPSIPPPPLFNSGRRNAQVPKTPHKRPQTPSTRVLRPCTPAQPSPFPQSLNFNASGLTPSPSPASKRKATTVDNGPNKRRNLFGVGPSTSPSKQSAPSTNPLDIPKAPITSKKKARNTRADIWACLRAISADAYDSYIKNEPFPANPPVFMQPPSTKWVACLICE
jgi:hypothetical protein